MRLQPTELTKSYKLYIPSTDNVDQRIDNKKYIDGALSLFSNLFGGATAYNARGAWMSDTKGLVTEEVTIVQAFTTIKLATKYQSQVCAYAEYVKRELHQEAVSVEYNNKLYFI